MNLKKIADEIAEKCGVETSVSLNVFGWSDHKSQVPTANVTIGIDDFHLDRHEGLEPTHESISEFAHKCADEWNATKDEREKAKLEAARALIAKHEGGDQ